MKKALISIFVIVVFVIYSLHASSEQHSVTVSAPTSLQSNSSSSNSSSSNAQTTSMSNATTASSNQGGSSYRNGAYTGSAADAYYGTIQVRVTINNGKLTDVAFLQYPNDQRESIEINGQAMPYLKQEAIQTQSAQVDGVSGATDTSQAFIQSLSSALSQART